MSLDPSKLLDPPMPSYAFTIYHRDVFEKSKFKNYDSLLKNRLARCEDRANYIASILDDNNNVEEGANYRIREKVPKSTSIYFAHGEYVASFLLGSNEIKTLLQIDTGSDLVWWQCGPCEANKCYKQVDPLYFPTNSKTYRKIDYHLPIRVTFGCGKDQMGRANFSGYYSGIVGLGRRVNVGSYSLPSQFQSDLMSICLPGFYSEIPVHPSWWTFTKGGGGGVLVDTGTTITRFPKDLYTVFRYTFLSEIKDIPLVKGPSKILDTCFKEDPSGRELYFPVVKLYFGGVNPNNMLLLAKDRVMVHLQGHYCLGFMGWNRSHSIIGSNQLQGIGLTFDTSENTLSFDLDACS
nr:protein ASPARTIC PROTEASE IN GUARD CELL 2-like [Solanum lycopersicum]